MKLTIYYFAYKLLGKLRYCHPGRVQVQKRFNFQYFQFYYSFSAIMHKTTVTIEQNGIISIICSCVFFGGG